MIGLDTSAAICLVEQIEPASTLITELLSSAQTRLIVATIAVAECLTLPIREKNSVLRQRYDGFFASPQVVVHDLSIQTALTVARLRASFGLKTPDAVHLASAIELGASDFLTTDAHDFSRCIGHVPITVRVFPRRPQAS